MANEVTLTTADDLTYAAMILQENIISALYAFNNAAPFVRKRSIAGMPSKALDFPKPPILTAASKAEATEDFTNLAFSTSKTTVTAGVVGGMLGVTDELSTSDVVDLQFYAQQLGYAIAAKFATDVFALFDGFSTVINDDASDLIEEDVLVGISTLEAANVPGPYIGGLHPTQRFHLLKESGTNLRVGSGDPVRARSNDTFGARPNGYWGPFWGCEWYTNSVIPSSGTSGYAGGLVSPDRALGHVEKWDVRIELERDASLRVTEIVATTMYGVGEIDDSSGVKLLSDT